MKHFDFFLKKLTWDHASWSKNWEGLTVNCNMEISLGVSDSTLFKITMYVGLISMIKFHRQWLIVANAPDSPQSATKCYSITIIKKLPYHSALPLLQNITLSYVYICLFPQKNYVWGLCVRVCLWMSDRQTDRQTNWTQGLHAKLHLQAFQSEVGCY